MTGQMNRKEKGNEDKTSNTKEHEAREDKNRTSH